MPSSLNRFAPLCLLLLLAGCNETPPSEQQTPALLTAAEAGDLPRILTLLQQPQQVDVRDACHWTPLMKAALNGHERVVRQLLNAGAIPDLIDTGGYSALMLAASNDHSEIVALLLLHGADIDRVEQTKGWTALIWAAKRGHLATVNALLEHGADRRHRDAAGKTALDWARGQGQEAVVARLARSRGRRG